MINISDCSTASNSSNHSYNLRKRSVLTYFPPSANKRTRITNSTIDASLNESTTMANLPLSVRTKKSKRKVIKKEADIKEKDKSKWKQFIHVKEEVLESGDCNSHFFKMQLAQAQTKLKCVYHIHQLPPNVIAMIFEILDPMERINIEYVCRRWHTISRRHAWTSLKTLCAHIFDVELSLRSARYVNNMVQGVVNRAGRYLEQIDFSGFTFLDYKICSLLRHTPRVIHLDLSGILLTNSSLSTIGNNLPGLESVVFRRCFHKTQVERGMSRFLQSCRRLLLLDLSFNEYFLGNQCFADLPPTLRHLYLNSTLRIGDAAAAFIQSNCPQLRTLVMDHIELISPNGLNQLFKSLTELELLHFNDCRRNILLTLAEVLSIGKMTKLKKLTMSNNEIVTDKLLETISENCFCLENINIKGSYRRVTDHGLRHLAFLPRLTMLNLYNVSSISDNTLCEIASNGKLEELTLYRCSNITDESIIYLLKRCKKLRFLDVSYCASVTDVSMKQLILSLNARHGKMHPPKDAPDSMKFSFSGKRSGLTWPPPKQLTHPWLNLSVEPEYEFVIMGHFFQWPNGNNIHPLQLPFEF